MKLILAMALTTLISGVTPALAQTASASVGAAREAEEHGRWEEACSLWAELVLLDPTSQAFRRGYLLALAARGAGEELDQAAAEAMGEFPGWDEPALLRGREWAGRGRLQDAIQLLDAYTDRSVSAAVDKAEYLEILGQGEEADALLSDVVALYDAGVSYSPMELLAFGRAAWARGDFHGAKGVLEKAYTDSLDFLPARLVLARLYHAKHNPKAAAEELSDAGKLARSHPDVQLALAELSLLSNQLYRAEHVAHQVQDTRPGDPGADRILVRLDIIAGLEQQARNRLETLLERNPYDREARSLLAAAAYFEGDSTTYREAVSVLIDADPDYVEPFLIIGDILELTIRNREAVLMYQRALTVDSGNAATLSSLGLLMMREGEEVLGRDYLERAFELDPFNLRAFNQLELLDEMDTFTSYPGENYVFKLHAEDDSLLVDLLHDKLERIREELVASHGWEPETPTIIEVFPQRKSFSKRVTGLAVVDGLQGVCFGNVVALNSPRTLAGHSNWEQVLRHEFGHVLALGMTSKQVPFWFTEGLCVHLEKHPRGISWDQNLVGAWWDGGIVSVDSLTIAFTRPRRREQRLLAYHQAGLILRDIEERHGWEVIPGLLREFGEGRSLQEAVPRVLDISYQEFTRRAQEVCTERARRVAGIWPRPRPERLGELSLALQEDPENLVLKERFLVTQVQLGQREEAIRTAREILQTAPGNARAEGLLGILTIEGENPAVAREHLENAMEAGNRDLPVHLALANLDLADGDTTAALAGFVRALEVYPLTSEALLTSARLLQARGDIEGARQNYRRLIEIDDTAGEGALELARLELDLGRGAEADASLDFALGILPMTADVYALLGQARLLLDRDDEAYALFRHARQLDLRNVEGMVGMARYYFRRGDYEESLYFARMAIKYAPDHRGARRILREAEAES